MFEAAYELCIYFLLYIGTVRCVNVQQNLTPLLVNKNDMAELTCRYDDSGKPNMLWYQQKDTAMTLIVFSYGATAVPSYEDEFKERFKLERTEALNGVLKISDLSLSDSAVYYCAVSDRFGTSQAIFGEGTRLTVLETGVEIKRPVVKILNETSCKEKVTLVCLAEDFYPDHVSIKWTRGSRENVTEDVATDPYATQDDATRMFRISSRLKVPKKDFTPKTMYTCTVTFIDDKNNATEIPAHIKGTGEAGYEPEDYLKSSQTISLAYGVFIAKSALYGLVILVFVCRRGSSGKRIN